MERVSVIIINLLQVARKEYNLTNCGDMFGCDGVSIGDEDEGIILDIIQQHTSEGASFCYFSAFHDLPWALIFCLGFTPSITPVLKEPSLTASRPFKTRWRNPLAAMLCTCSQVNLCFLCFRCSGGLLCCLHFCCPLYCFWHTFRSWSFDLCQYHQAHVASNG